MGHNWSVVLDRLVIILLAVILLVPPAALPFSEPVPQAFAQTNFPPTYLDTFGSQGNGNGEFGNNGPWGIDVTPSGDVWVMDYKNEHAQKFSSSGDFLLLIGSVGNGDSQFNNNGPRDIAVDSTGSFWITDTKDHKIKKFDSNGNHLLTFGSQGSGDTEFRQPSGVAIDSLNNVYVVDTNNEQIKKFDSNGNHLLTFGGVGNGDSQFINNGPRGIAIDSLDNIWVTDTAAHKIKKFDSNGNHLLTFGSQGSGDTEFRQPNAIAVDSFDNVWIADTNNDRIVAYDLSGNFLTKYGVKGSGEGEFGDNGPRGISFDSASSIFYVTDTKNNRIHKFQNNLTIALSVPGTPTNLISTAGDTEVSLSWTAPADDTVIDYYAVQSRLTGSGSWSLLGNIQTTSATVTGLTNDSEYEFQVSAYNSVGGGSTVSVFATPVASVTTIDPPTNLIATAGDTEVSLSWTAPTSSSSDIVFDNVVDNSNNLCTGTSCSISITVAEGNNRMIIVSTADEDPTPDDIDSIDVNENTDVGILVGREDVVTGTGQQVELWRIMESDITTGSNTITINYSSSISGGGITVMSFSNVSQQAEESENSATATETSNVSAIVTTQTDGALIVSVVGNGQGGSYISHGTDQIEQADFNPSSAAMSVTTEIKTIAGSDTQSHTSSSSANRHAQYVGVFAPVSSGVSITDYKIEYSSNSGSSWSTFPHGDASTTETISELTNDQEYSFRVSSVASDETSSPSDIVIATPGGESNVPNAPTNLTATAGNTEVTLSWTAPSDDGGSSLTDYVLEYSSNDGSTWIIFDDGIDLTTSATITELTNDQEYSFRVSAVNSSGTGAGTPSRTITATPVDAGNVPNAPTNLTATAGNTEVTLSWTAPSDDGGSSLTDYVVQYRTIDSSIVSLLNNKCLDVVDSSNGANVQMITCDNSDNQKWNIDGDTITSQLNDKCLDIEGGNTSDGANVLMWTCHGGDNQKWIESAENEWLTFEDGSETAVSTTVSNLINGQEYEFRVFAVNAIGTSSASNVSTATPSVTGTVPNTPTGLSAVPGDTQITLSWTAPTVDGGSSITDYIIEYSSDAGASWSTFTDGTSSSTSVIITGLVNNQEYTFRVSAVNSTGTGPTSLHILATPNPATTLEVRVNHDDDDAEEKVSNGRIDLSSSDLELVDEGNSEQEVGIRFNDITIPPTAIISSAFVQFTVDETDDDPTNLTIFAEDVDSSMTFDDDNDNITDRPKTTTSISWSLIPAWNTVGEAGNDQKTPDIKTIIQEVIDRDGWSSGNSLSIIITGDGERTAESYNGDSSKAPQLIINYSTAVEPPSQPTALTAIPGDTEVSLTWATPSSNGGASITDYIIEYSDDAGSNWTIFEDDTSTTTSVIIPSLLNGVEYTFRVSAVNSSGTGPVSSTVTATPSSLPDAPTNLVASGGNNQVSLTWTAPVITGGSPITDYIIEFNAGSGWTTFDDGESTTTSAIVNDLVNGQSYSFRILSVNSVGSSIPSDSASAIPTSTSTAPTNLVATSGDSQVSLTWLPPSDDGGSPITDYLVEYSDDAGDTWDTFADGTSDTASAIVIGLVNGQEYYFRVSAVNAVATSLPSGIVISIPGSAPDKPTDLIATRGNAEVSLTWIAPLDDGGSPITDYIIEFSLDGSSWTIINDGPGTGTTTTVTGLTNGEIYSFRISAVNAIGTGIPSLVVVATPATIPDAPDTFVGVRGDTQVSLSWMATSNNGDAVTDYIIEFNDGSGWTTFDDGESTTTSAIVTDLVNGQSYSFRVSAINSVGSSLHSTTISVTPATLSTPPLNPVATSGNAQVSLSWDVPADDGGEDIVDYVIEVSLDNTNWTVYTDGVDLATTAIVTSLINGQTYYFRILAENDVGTSIPSDVINAIPATVAGAPTNLAATVGNTEVSLSWTAPLSTGGSPITDYLVEYSSDSGSTWTIFDDGTSTTTTTTVTNLLNGQSYDFRVFTINSVGPSNPSVLIDITPATVPAAPTNLTATAGDTTVSLSWTAPTNIGGSPITDYLVEYSDDAGDTWNVFDDDISTTPTSTVTDLSNGQSYDFRVSTITSVGTSISSDVVDATPVTTPDAPTNLSATAGNTEVSLTWTTPVITGGSDITDYLVEHSTDGSTWTTFDDDISTETSATVTDLSNGQSYSFRVSAINEVGTGTSSLVVDATPATTPEAPTNLVTVHGNTQVTLSWTAPVITGGSPITDYLVEFNDGSGWETFADGTSPLTTATVTDLTNGQSYSFRVSAINEVGTGTSSLVVDATPATTPDAPTNLSATAGNTEVSLSWTAPSDGGSTITDYLVEFNDGSGWETFADGTSPLTTATVTGLTNGQQYSFRVSAINAIGTGSTSLVEIITPATTSTKPLQLSATPGDGKVSLTWVAPTNNGGATITDYLVEYSTNEIDWTIFDDGTSTTPTATVTDLSNGQSYSFRVSAINEVGTGTPSDTVTATPATTSEAPTGLTATSVSSTAIDLSWTAPLDTGGELIIGYQIERQTGTGVFEIIVSDTETTDTAYSDSELTAGTSYTYRVAAITTTGTGAVSGTAGATTFDLPTIPTNLTAVGANTEVTLTWTAPSDGGSTITDYLVEFNDGSGWETFADGTSPLTTATVTGLLNGQSYDFRVSAVNAIGTGPTSNIATATPSLSVTIIHQISQSSDDAEESLIGNQNNKELVCHNGHTISISENALSAHLNHGDTLGACDGSDTAGRVNLDSSDLDLDQEDYVGVRFNGLNIPSGSTISNAYVEFTSEDNESGSSSVTIYGHDVDDAPTFTEDDNNISSRVSTSATISWIIPTWSEDEVGPDTQTPDITTILQELIDRPGWQSGNSFVLIFEEVNHNNDRDAYSYDQSPIQSPKLYITFDFPQNVPDTPENLTATAGDGEVSLSWDAPSNNGGALITDYLVEYKLSTEPTVWTPFPHGDASTTETVTGLINGLSYDFRVSAVNSVGTSDPSDVVSETPIGVLGPPTNLIGTRGNAEVSLSWTAPPSGSSPITDYLVEVNDGSGWDPFVDDVSTDTFATVTGLTNGQSYDFRVSAINAIGTSAPSNIVTVIPATVPDAPTDPVATAGNAEAFFSWTAPTGSATGGSPIIDYIVEYSSDSGSSWITFPDGFSTDTFATVTGLNNGIEYQFRVSAVNDVGTGASSIPVVLTPATVPDEPTDLDPTPGNTEVDLTWVAPVNNGGSPITDYLIEYIVDGVNWIPFDDGPPSTTTSATVTGLTNGVLTGFRVFAVNAIGTSLLPSNVVTATPATVPDAPTNLAATPLDSQVLLTWTAPTGTGTGGSPITQYVVDYSTDNFATFTSVISANIAFTVSPLNNGQEYQFRVFAENAVGLSEEPSDTAIATPVGFYDAPENLVATRGNAEVSLVWDAPTNNAGLPLLDYLVEYKLTSEPTIWTTFPHGTTTPATIVTGLTNGLSYDFRVSAINALGTGASSTVATATPATLPDKPIGLDTTFGNRQVSLTWTAPSDGGSPIIDYVIEYKLTSEPTVWTIFADGTSAATTATVTGLTNGQPYDFRVSATNDVGTGPVSATVTDTPFTVPDAPTNLSVELQSGQVNLEWVAPTDDGGSPVIDYLVEYSIDGTFWFLIIDFVDPATTTALTIDDLINGQEYFFRVLAVNAIGNSLPSGFVGTVPAGPPDAPTGLITTPGNSQVSLVWNAPLDDGGAPLLDYLVEYSADSGTTWITFDFTGGLTTTTTIAGLTNGVDYSFRVSTINEVGAGDSSTVVNATPVTILGVPTNPAALRGNTQVILSWTAPINDSGLPITDYIIESSTDGVIWITFADGTSTATSATVDNLTNGVTYQFRVSAVNAVGTGATSNIVSAIPSTTPDVPLALSTVPGNAFATLTWSTPIFDGGNVITDYVLEYSADSGATWIIFNDGTSTALSATVSSLTNGVDYSFRVSGANVIGTGPPSNEASAIPIDLSVPPSGLTAITVSSTQIDLNWIAPASTGVVTGYQIERQTGTGSFTIIASDTGSTNTTYIDSSLIAGTDYTYRVSAIISTAGAASGTASATTFNFANAPTNLTSDAGISLVSLYWTVSSDDGGSPITDYIVEYSDDSGTTWNTFDDGLSTTTTAIVTGLTNDVSYSFRVSAVNSVGTGTASVIATGTPITVPDAPTGLTTISNNTFVTLSWTAPTDDGGSSITDYIVEYSIDGTNWTTFDDGTSTATTATVTNLINGQQYNFRVSAVNSVGTGDTSTPATTTPATTSDAPTDLIAVPEDTFVTLSSWTAPTDDGGSSITDYIVEYSIDGTNWTTFDDGTSTATTATVTNLINGQQYNFRVSAVNSVGTGTPSDTATVTPATLSSAPFGLLTAVLSGTAIDLSWTAPTDTGGAVITGYKIERQTGSNAFVTITANTGSTSTAYGDSGLSPGITYTYRVSTVTAAGTSDSTGATATTFTLPSSPITLTATPDDAITSLFWSAPLSDGGSPITDYRVEYNDGTGWVVFDDGVGLNTTTVVTGLTNGVEYVFQVLAMNSVGTGPASNIVPATPSGVPDTPSGLIPILGNTQVSLTWGTPSNNGASISNYLVEFNAGSEWISFPETISLTSVTVDNLSNGISYSFRVSAENAVGTSPVSADVTATPATTPGIPTGLSAIPDNKQVSLSWVAPSDGGSTITDYLVEYSDDDGVTWNIFNDGTSSSTFTIVTDLNNGKEYQFRVSAINSIAPGSLSAIVNTIPITVAASPTGLTATTVSSLQISLVWNAPSGTGGSPIIGYLIERYDDTLSKFVTLVADTGNTSTSYSDTGLDPGVNYQYRVSVNTDAGTGDPSGKSSATTLSIPSAPTNLTVTPGDSQVLLTWTASTGGGVSIDDYVIEYSLDSGSNWNTFDDGVSTSTTETVTGLANGQEYQFRVYSVNSVGNSLTSSVETETPFALPDAITNLVAARGPADAKLTWTAPADNGRPITDYVVEISNDDGVTWVVYDDGVTTDPSAVVLELVPGQTTQFRVYVINLAGTGPVSNIASATPAIVPDPPTGLIAILDTETSTSATVVLTWSPPSSDGGAAITQYIIEISDDNFLTKQNILHSGTSFTITDLLNGVDYSFRLKSLNSIGTSEPSVSVSVSVFDKPTFDAKIIATPGDSSAILKWDVVADDNGSEITEYSVIRRTVDTTDADGDGLDDIIMTPLPQSQLVYDTENIATVTSITVINLTNDETYVFEVAPVNAAGPATSTNAVVVIPHSAAEDENVEFVENPDISAEQEAAQEDKGREGDYIPPSSSLVNGTDFDFFDTSYNQNIIYADLVTDDELNNPATLATAYGLPEYSPPEELGEDQVWAVPPAIIELEETGFQTIVTISPANAPTSLSATSGQPNQIPLSWVAPSDDGSSTVTGYLVEYLFDETWYSVDQTISSTNLTFPDSINGQQYSFRVYAINGAGIGTVSSTVVATSFDVPKAPVDVTTGSGNAQVVILWTAPSDGGSPITDYIVETSMDSGTTWTTYDDGVGILALASVMGLTNGQEIYLRISAVNAAGTGLASNAVSEIPATISDRPSGLILTVVSSSQIDISWNAPGDTGGSSIIGYKIDRSISSGPFTTIVDNTNSISTNYSDANLFAGVDYSYKLYAITTAGTSDSSGIAQTTTFDVPQSPTSLSIGATSSSLNLIWLEPDNDGGTPITGYQIERKVVGGEFEILISNTGSTTTVYDDTGLTSDTTYTYQVSAINAVGTSSSSDTEFETTLGSPSAPLGLEATAGKDKVQLVWGTPFSDGGEDVIDYIVQYKIKTAASWSTFNDGVGIDLIALVTPLTNNVEYSFRVLAVNSIGTGVASAIIDAKPSIPGSAAAYSISEIESGQDVFLPHNEDESLDNGGKMVGVKITPTEKMSSFFMTSTFQKDAPTGITQGADMYLKFELDFVSEEESTATLPGAPTNLSVISTVSTQANLSWTAPSDDGGADVAGYKIERSIDAGSSWSVIDADTKSTSTSYTEGGLTNGQTYYYKVSAINLKGTGTASDTSNVTPLGTPSEPFNITAAPEASGELTLTWTAPLDDGGSSVTDYLIHYTTDLQFWNTFDDGTSAATTTTVTGLTNNQNYIFRIFAVNFVGTANPSDLVSGTPSIVVDIPSSLSTTAISAAEIDLSWVAPSSPGGTITGYQIERQIGTIFDTNWMVIVSDTATTTTVYSDTGLFGGTTYSYRVSAITDGSNVGTSSSASQSVTYSVSDAPTGVTVVSLPSKYVLSWTAPSDDGGQSIFDYFVQSSIDGGTTWKTLIDNVDTKTSLSVTGDDAQNGVTYTLRVYAVNLIGTSSASPTVTVTPLTVPTAPRSLDATSVSGQVTLSWAAPLDDGGAAITDYIVRFSDNDGSTFSTFADGTSTATTATVTGLTDDVQYQFRITAVNSEGSGPASSGRTVTVGVTVEDDTNDFTSIEVTFLFGEKSGSEHPIIPENSVNTALICPEPQVYFITDNNETVFTDITITRSPLGDITDSCAYSAILPHFSTYGISTIDSKFAVGAAGLAVAGGNVALPPIITGIAMYSFGAPTLNEDGQLVFTKTGSYQPITEYSQTLPTTTLIAGETSQIAVRIFDYNGPEAVEHVGLYLNLFGVEYQTEDSDTYILYDEGEDFTLVDPTGLLSDVSVSTRIEDTLLWVIFDMTFEQTLDTSNINVNAWNSHRARAEHVAYEILKVTDLLPGIEQITGSDVTGSKVDTSFYIVESVTDSCEVCSSPFELTFIDDEIQWTNHDSSIRTIISGDQISGFDGLFKSNFIFQDNSYSTTIENSDYYTMYDILEDQYHSSMIVEVSEDPITDARLLESPTMPYTHRASKITSASTSGMFAMDVSIPDTLRLFGSIYDVDTRQAVLLDIVGPEGIVAGLKLSSNSDGYFTTIQNIPDTWDDGVYTVSFNVTEKHITSIYFKLESGKILPMFVPTTDVVTFAESIIVTTPELILLHAGSLGRDGNMLIVEGHIDSGYGRVVISIENPDDTVDEYTVLLNGKQKYSLPLIRTEWLSGDYTVTVSDEKTDFATKQFTVFEDEETKSALEHEFESVKADGLVVINNINTEVILLADDYFEQIDTFTAESVFGSLHITRPDTKISQSTLEMSGTVGESLLNQESLGLIEITLIRPTGDIEKISTLITSDGIFETILIESWLSGDYTVEASYNDNIIAELTFFIGDRTTSDVTPIACPTSDCVSIESEPEDEISNAPIMIVFTGDVENVDTSILLEFTIVRPDNTSFDLTALLSNTGELESQLIHSESWMSGVYTVIVSYHGEQLSAASFRK